VLVVPVSDPTQTKVLLCKCRGTAAQLLAEACMLAGLHDLPWYIQTCSAVFLQAPIGIWVFVQQTLLLLLLTQEPVNALFGTSCYT